jgi:hypothetical protein
MIKDPVKLHQLIQETEQRLNEIATGYDAHIFLTDDNKISKISFSDTFVRDKVVTVVKRLDGTHTEVTTAVDKSYPEYYPEVEGSAQIPRIKVHQCERVVVEHPEISSSAHVRHFEGIMNQLTLELENK